MANTSYFENYYAAWQRSGDQTPLAASEVATKIVSVTLNANSILGHNNIRQMHFLSLQKILVELSGLSEEDDFYLSPEVAHRASEILGAICQNIDIEAPRFFPQDGEAAVFTWDGFNIKRFLTVDEEDIDILDLEKTNFIKCKHEMPVERDEQLSFAIKELSGPAWLSNVTVD